MDTVQVQIVAYNSVDVLAPCLTSVLRQSYPAIRVLVIDNASSDGSAAIAQGLSARVECVSLQTNLGYAGGHNLGFRRAMADRTPYVLTLNPDVVLDEDYVVRALAPLQMHERLGGVTGKLLRPSVKPDSSKRTRPIAGREPVRREQQVLDSTGLTMGPFFHIKDRSSGLPDQGAYEVPEKVWGVCGAAALYRTEMLEGLRLCDEIFDESFFIYKEDVDLCWRAVRLGWAFWYEPKAMAEHCRTGKNHAVMSDQAVAHSFANQIALLVTYARHFTPYVAVTILVEVLRLMMLLRRPRAATLAWRLLRRNWRTMWSKRALLREVSQ